MKENKVPIKFYNENLLFTSIKLKLKFPELKKISGIYL